MQAHGPNANFLHPVLVFIPRGSVTTKGNGGNGIGDPGVRRMHLYHDRWTDWTGPEDLLAVHDFMRYVEHAVFTQELPLRRQFHTNLDFWNEQCFKQGAAAAEASRNKGKLTGEAWKAAQELYSAPRDEFGMTDFRRWLMNYPELRENGVWDRVNERLPLNFDASSWRPDTAPDFKDLRARGRWRTSATSSAAAEPTPRGRTAHGFAKPSTRSSRRQNKKAATRDHRNKRTRVVDVDADSSSSGADDAGVVKEQFDAFDNDGSSSIDSHEMYTVMLQIAEAESSSGGGSAVVSEEDRSEIVTRVSEMMVADTSGDGVVDLAEFTAMIEPGE